MSKKYSVYLLIIILIIGIFLRFYRIRELSTFLADQAIELSGARQILQGKYTLIGIKTSNSELHNGAVMYYLLTPFLYFLKNDPLAGGILQSLLSLGTIPLVFFLGSKFYNSKVGLIASFMIAASPILVKYSRQTMLAYYPLFFTSLFLLTLTLFLQSKFNKTFLNIFLGFLLGFMLQIHYSTVAFLIFAFIFPIIFLPKQKIFKFYFKLTIGFVLGFLPMIIFEFRHQFFNTQMFIKLITGGISSSKENFNLLFYWFESLGKAFWAESAIIALIITAFTFWIGFNNRKKLSVLEKLCILQIFSVFIFTLIFVRENVAHYIIAAFVPFAFLFAITLYKFNSQLFLFVPVFFLINFKSYGLSDDHGWTMTKGWSLPQTEAAAKIITGDNPENFNVTMAVDYQNQGLPLRYFLTGANKIPLSETEYDRAEVLYILVQPNLELDQIRMWELDSFGKYNVTNVWPLQNKYLLYRLNKGRL